MIRINLDDILKEKNITAKELSKRINITEANLSILRTGRAKAIRFNTLSAICKNLDCQPGDILKYEEAMMKKFTIEKKEERYFILGDDKAEILKAEGNENKVELLDLNGKKLAEISKKRIQLLPSDMPVFEVEFIDGQKIDIQKEMKNFKSLYEINGMETKTDKSIFGDSFRVDMKETFANVKRQGYKYQVEVKDEECIHKFAAFLIAVTMVMEFENIK